VSQCGRVIRGGRGGGDLGKLGDFLVEGRDLVDPAQKPVMAREGR